MYSPDGLFASWYSGETHLDVNNCVVVNSEFGTLSAQVSSSPVSSLSSTSYSPKPTTMSLAFASRTFAYFLFYNNTGTYDRAG